jgi:hypothetical protein
MNKGLRKVEVYQSTFTMDNVEQSLSFVKFAIKHKNTKRTQIMIVTTCMDMVPRTLFKIEHGGILRTQSSIT